MTSSCAGGRRARARRYLMCRPTYFDVRYAINPWMDPAHPVDTARACAQWEALRALYRDLGHTVELIDPLPGLPDMVYAANGGLVVGGRAVGVRFRHPERRGEQAPYLRRLAKLAPDGVHRPLFCNEGEGDFLPVGEMILAGTGFRSEPAAHAETARVLRRPVHSLTLVDPRFYHLDTALCVLADDLVAYLPAAFDDAARRLLATLFPDAIKVSEADAVVFGLNAVSDGLHVVLSAAAQGFAAELRSRGFEPIGIEFDELRRGGGGIKCATLEIRA
ncbi:arginine deiminase-related protein [Frankia sp. AiPs1]|uniref:dimethylargininase n=1 Tax=Frankia sp. AiPs1 TaxID=573493 RepID=UPI002042C32B|nr:dimethylargininase [Frankia sp. AiPs1]MCM3923790.1 arginine deiminase-related protein [Frankia sp. AiPs1]